ncbi:MAG: hypothetical protein RBU21_13790 [FCB group bacterium]|jgi:hypothetical protein|nr:hypothetical protein [FCB group bacterium]
MENSHKDVFEKLEEAVTQWGEQVSGAQEGLAEELTRARGRLDAVRGDLAATAPLPAVLQELRNDLNSLRELLANPSAPSPAPDQPELRATVEDLRADVQSIRNDLDDLRERLAILPRLAEHIERLTSVPAGPPAANATPPENAPGLNDSVWQEVARLRAQLDDDAPIPSRLEGLSGIERMAYDSEGHRRRIGEVLHAAGMLDEGQIDQALAEQVNAPYRRLGSILVEKGYAPEEVVARVLAGQLRTRFVRLTDENIDKDAVPLIGPRMARQHTCIPIAATEDRLTLALANPFDLVAIDDVELASQRRVDTVVAAASDIEAAIQRLYGG